MTRTPSIGRRIRRLGFVTSIAGLVLGGALVTAGPASAATTCAPTWSASTAYSGGASVSTGSTNYTANWWTQGDDPATHSGATGSGQPWTSAGSCTPASTGGGGTGGGGSGGGTGGGTGTGATTGTLFSPYKDVTVNLNWNTNVMQTAITGSTIPVAGGSNSLATKVPKLRPLSLAFATGTCGSENWGGVAGDAFAKANVLALDAAGVDYVVSTGGAAGSFKCTSGAAMNAFIARYASPHLVGIDFDIESGQSAADIRSLVSSAAAAQAQYPKLRFSFTLATLAASNGSFAGLNSTGDTTVTAIKASGLTNYTINLMTMDFGGASSAVCVVTNGACDMGASTVQAVKNLQHTYGTPSNKIEVTPMIGVNDVVSNVFTLADVDTVSAYARANALAGVHYWSLDRDTPCAQSTASATCSSRPDAALSYTNRFLTALGK
ncbi:carbohydrate-binding protein [Curtobacterium sp. MCPF17_047]|uniref:carbohydrate-binding protein n=1 Tax=Curtobacterium sp. MCPF17_047 TaxID=2175654 RepID=UPI000DA8EF31|nr:carbohydrate-binding protein [Curtobacterium sp. MCPF17_047]PZF62878.1 carbohydrate-binding protein [Curtobacterium sp. MCPF17_047]